MLKGEGKAILEMRQLSSSPYIERATLSLPGIREDKT